jgi:hypothetical protein
MSLQKPSFCLAGCSQLPAKKMTEHLKFEYEFFKNAYEREVTRLESLRGRGTWICSQLAILGAALYYFAWNYQRAELPLVNFGFWSLWAIASARFLFALWRMFGFIRVRLKNADPGAPLPLYEFARKLEQRNARVTTPLDVEEHLIRDFTGKFAVCAERNYHNNHKRTVLLIGATQAASDVLFLLAFCVPFVLCSESRKVPEPIRIKITHTSVPHHCN